VKNDFRGYLSEFMLITPTIIDVININSDK